MKSGQLRDVGDALLILRPMQSMEGAMRMNLVVRNVRHDDVRGIAVSVGVIGAPAI